VRLITTRETRIQGRAYRPGEAVDTKLLDSDKVQQLVALRILKDPDLQAPARCVALRSLNLQGKQYKRGDIVDTSTLRSDKVSQLLDHRMIDLARRLPDARPAKQARA
jgi:hypothetical protein